MKKKIAFFLAAAMTIAAVMPMNVFADTKLRRSASYNNGNTLFLDPTMEVTSNSGDGGSEVGADFVNTGNQILIDFKTRDFINAGISGFDIKLTNADWAFKYVDTVDLTPAEWTTFLDVAANAGFKPTVDTDGKTVEDGANAADIKYYTSADRSRIEAKILELLKNQAGTKLAQGMANVALLKGTANVYKFDDTNGYTYTPATYNTDVLKATEFYTDNGVNEATKLVYDDKDVFGEGTAKIPYTITVSPGSSSTARVEYNPADVHAFEADGNYTIAIPLVSLSDEDADCVVEVRRSYGIAITECKLTYSRFSEGQTSVTCEPVEGNSVFKLNPIVVSEKRPNVIKPGWFYLECPDEYEFVNTGEIKVISDSSGEQTVDIYYADFYDDDYHSSIYFYMPNYIPTTTQLQELSITGVDLRLKNSYDKLGYIKLTIAGIDTGIIKCSKILEDPRSAKITKDTFTAANPLNPITPNTRLGNSTSINGGNTLFLDPTMKVSSNSGDGGSDIKASYVNSGNQIIISIDEDDFEDADLSGFDVKLTNAEWCFKDAAAITYSKAAWTEFYSTAGNEAFAPTIDASGATGGTSLYYTSYNKPKIEAQIIKLLPDSSTALAQGTNNVALKPIEIYGITYYEFDPAGYTYTPSTYNTNFITKAGNTLTYLEINETRMTAKIPYTMTISDASSSTARVTYNPADIQDLIDKGYEIDYTIAIPLVTLSNKDADCTVEVRNSYGILFNDTKLTYSRFSEGRTSVTCYWVVEGNDEFVIYPIVITEKRPDIIKPGWFYLECPDEYEFTKIDKIWVSEFTRDQDVDIYYNDADSDSDSYHSGIYFYMPNYVPTTNRYQELTITGVVLQLKDNDSDKFGDINLTIEGVNTGTYSGGKIPENAQSANITKETFTAARRVGSIAPKLTLNVTTDACIITKGKYFNVNTAFSNTVASNTAILTYTYDSSKFDYREFKPADGVTALSTSNNNGVLKITVMVDGYNTKNYGDVVFSAKEDIDLTKDEYAVIVSSNYVLKDDAGNKEIAVTTGSTTIITRPDPEVDTDFTLIGLSNIIDMFGYSKTTTGWDEIYKFFDFNRNGIIDISDVVYVANNIK